MSAIKDDALTNLFKNLNNMCIIKQHAVIRPIHSKIYPHFFLRSLSLVYKLVFRCSCYFLLCHKTEYQFIKFVIIREISRQ